MWLLHLLLESWRERLGRLQELATEPSGSQWLWQARARILRFLISRYGDGAAAAPRAKMRPLKEVPRVTFCRVEPREAPPKSRDDLSGIFRSIRRANVEARGRLRWRWI